MGICKILITQQIKNPEFQNKPMKSVKIWAPPDYIHGFRIIKIVMICKPKALNLYMYMNLLYVFNQKSDVLILKVNKTALGGTVHYENFSEKFRPD